MKGPEHETKVLSELIRKRWSMKDAMVCAELEAVNVVVCMSCRSPVAMILCLEKAV